MDAKLTKVVLKTKIVNVQYSIIKILMPVFSSNITELFPAACHTFFYI